MATTRYYLNTEGAPVVSIDVDGTITSASAFIRERWL